MQNVISILMFLIALSTGSAWADEETPIAGATLICSQEGGAVFINAREARLWQAELPTATQGLELQVTKFDYMRCPHCYRIEARIPESSENTPSLVFETIDDRTAGDAEMTVSMIGANGTKKPLAAFPCKAIPRAAE